MQQGSVLRVYDVVNISSKRSSAASEQAQLAHSWIRWASRAEASGSKADSGQYLLYQ